MPSFPSLLIPKQLGSPVGLLRSKLSIQGLKFKPLPLQNWAMANVYQYNEEVGEARRSQLEINKQKNHKWESKLVKARLQQKYEIIHTQIWHRKEKIWHQNQQPQEESTNAGNGKYI